MKEIKIAGIIRKSPSKQNATEISVQAQRNEIEKRIHVDFEGTNINPRIIWFVDDQVSGDDPNRPALKELFDSIHQYSYAYVRDVDRFSRSYLGLMWFHQYFITERGLEPHTGCELIFCQGVGDLYDKDKLLNSDSYMTFFFFCGIAQGELIRSRQRCEAGREKLRGTPEWKKKFKGRPKAKKK